MNINVQSFARYWRNSLADAISVKGALTKKDIEQFIICDFSSWQDGQVSGTETKKLFQDEPDNVKTIDIILRPIIYHKKTEHAVGKSQDIPEFVVPIATSALLTREGQLFPLKDQTIISRDILEPLAQGAFTIGSVDNLDRYLTSQVISGIDYIEEETQDDEVYQEEYRHAWNQYLEDCGLLLTAVTQKWLENNNTFEQVAYGFIVKKNVIKGAAVHILPLYDKLGELSNTAIPLFETFSAKQPAPKRPCLKENALFSKRLAHSSNEFPLANAQRDALNHLLTTERGDILAVNGPPGTGKTTMLLSVVASLWSQHALDEKEPPVIVAASTNNQAVTNIIDAFGKDFSTGDGALAGRWLPDINSFGGYYPSKTKATKVAKTYQTDDFFDQIETLEYVQKAKQHYTECVLRAFPELNSGHNTVKDSVTALHTALKNEVKHLQKIEQAWKNLAKIRQEISQRFGESSADVKNNNKQQLHIKEKEKEIWLNVETAWQHYLADENIGYVLFSWISVIAQKRLLKAILYLKKIWPAEWEQPQWKTIDSISQFIKNTLASLDQAIQNSNAILQETEQLFLKREKYLHDWKTALLPLGITDNTQTMTLADVDRIADTHLRFNIFLLTTHYWEGRWLMDMENQLPSLVEWKRKNGQDAIKKRWQLRMKLTPCIVSTFYVLPAKFIYTEMGYTKNYLYNFADLLIVDEAGQVLPEVAGASFSLAQKALVIGDTLQIEPIWSIPPKVDIGNLQATNIICSTDVENEYDILNALGKTASSGCVMKIAQQASQYHYDQDMQPGMFLYEHRRCYDEIIDFCNTLIYKNKLKPMRGRAPENTLFPALGYLHIDGICQQTYSGSRINKLDASVIAKWLIHHKEALEEAYNEPIHKLIGIVTPFSAQVSEIKKAIKTSKSDINVDGGENSLIVGTVHALQGAERKIIIFSTVYSKHANGHFIDQQPSILNVAVSRAKNSFLIFGDMDLFSPAAQTPRGLLAKYLFNNVSNQLYFEYIAREDLISLDNVTLQILRDAQAHDEFLLNTINHTQKEIIIVSPWVKLAAIEHINILPIMEAAVQKGIKVSVYTDLALNTSHSDKEKQKTQHHELFNIMTQFKNRGIDAHFVDKVHSKLVIKDDNLLCVGSFNWLSAQREGKYVRHETSITYLGENKMLLDEIHLLKSSITDKQLTLSAP